ncbi:hypothetical protein [Actimicrobium sp. CCI2.3]|uniref:hypothetical protein n=1 Tax=Actimicrobium sp. CCI2.3 TaxID=3048616 RepID=UPI002B24F638|nr:hypothetical protein [Actimicrobium sp. CCI2.3]MEB0020193.1 hypothetical protein [Actimicrobium sp. CCI2.3]
MAISKVTNYKGTLNQTAEQMTANLNEEINAGKGTHNHKTLSETAKQITSNLNEEINAGKQTEISCRQFGGGPLKLDDTWGNKPIPFGDDSEIGAHEPDTKPARMIPVINVPGLAGKGLEDASSLMKARDSGDQHDQRKAIKSTVNDYLATGASQEDAEKLQRALRHLVHGHTLNSEEHKIINDALKKISSVQIPTPYEVNGDNRV